ncbi:DUF86 domain-containing protein [Cohnella sp.]|uniref:DUF86 domain-containing protein n=1 Tax=Cohnella sp. TaxID=1883426 RepID=UPI003564978C
MYDVNRDSIGARLNCVPDIAEALTNVAAYWTGTLVQGLAQERALHLAAEIATDVGHTLIDGFIMRDASSYEDIIDIIAEEGVITVQVAAILRQVVLLRKSLVQEYDRWPRRELHPLTAELPKLLLEFSDQVKGYLHKELDNL